MLFEDNENEDIEEKEITEAPEEAVSEEPERIRLFDEDPEKVPEEDKNTEEDSEELMEQDAEPDTEEADEAAEDEEDEEEPEKEKLTPKKFFKEVFNVILTILIAVVAAFLINIFIIRVSVVNGKSMEPTFSEGQFVVMSRLPYIFSKPNYNDIVIFDSENTEPGQRTFINDITDTVKYNVISTYFNKKNTTHKYWIKRVIGLPGDVIEIKDGGLYRNGELLTEDYIKDQEWEYKNEPYYHVVEEGCIFVMGDNRNNSSDSRKANVGDIAYSAVIGKVLSGGNKK